MSVDLSSILRVLKSFTSPHHLSSGLQFHSLLLRTGHLTSLFASNSLLHFYSRCSSNPEYARNLFDSMPARNSFSFNTLVDCYLNAKQTHDAVSVFRSNPDKNSYSWASIVAGLAKCGDLENARDLFDEMPVKDATTLNALLHNCFRYGKALDGFLVYRSAGLDDKFVLATVISGCADCRASELGKQIHARIVLQGVELDCVLGSALVDMYGKCEDLDNSSRVLDLMETPDEYSLSALVSSYSNHGRVEDAIRVFNRKGSRGVVLWNSMINGYVRTELVREAWNLFGHMRREVGVAADCSTFAILLSGCASLGILETVKQIHACALKHGVIEDVVFVSVLIDTYSKCGELVEVCLAFNEAKDRDTILLNSMINVYSNCGMVDEARRVFNSIRNKSIISWNSMVVAYSQNACAHEAIAMLAQMHKLDLRLDKVALASAISASASICSLRLGEQLFSLTTVIGLDADPIISTSVIDLYCKCGSVASGWRVFNCTSKPDKVLWNSMMIGYASNGHGTEVLSLFETMRSENISPNEVSFIAVLSGCCHSGLVEEGLKWFYRMKEEYGINPTVEHCSLVVDLLVRAGKIEEAMDFIDTMPFEADVSMLTSVLGGCKARGDEYLGCKVADRLMNLDPRQSGPLMQISGMYAAQGKWETSEKIRQMMRERSIAKNPGYSWTDT